MFLKSYNLIRVTKLYNFKKYNVIANNYIHNQSYIHLDNKYNKLQEQNKNNENLIKDLNSKIVQLESKNNKLQEQNKIISLELHQKTIFYNLNLYK